MQLDIVSDYVCPWCYVGKRRLEKALQQRPDLDVTVRWLPFQLSPDIPSEGIDRMEYYVSIFGEQRAKQIVASMADTGKDEAIEFQNKPGAMSPNTLRAHMLMDLAQSSENGDADLLAERLFHAHHVACDNIGDPQVLASIAAECGLDAATVAAWIDDPANQERVKASIEESAKRGVTGVPFFVFANQYGLSGAQPVDEFVATLDQLHSEANG
jgi:predicted DsbA family dithiol-disulfide isomerase